jgi:hypothetical protein
MAGLEILKIIGFGITIVGISFIIASIFSYLNLISLTGSEFSTFIFGLLLVTNGYLITLFGFFDLYRNKIGHSIANRQVKIQ